MTSAKLVNELFLWEIHFSSVDLVNEISDKKYNFGAVYGVLSLNEEYRTTLNICYPVVTLKDLKTFKDIIYPLLEQILPKNVAIQFRKFLNQSDFLEK